ncbi:MAG: replicative DNA helicase [Lachnospiraceae bacterium]|nr:replicative DNA helicase [Lachnospiraceae bacterium]
MDEASIRRVQPNDAMAEQAVVGAMIKDNEMIPVASEIVTPDDFYSPKYGKIFEIILEMNDAGSSVDILTLRDKLKEKNVPEEYSSLETLRDLLMSVPTAANIRNYARIVSKNATLRRLIKAADEITEECYSDGNALEDVLDRSEKRIYDISQRQRSGDYVSIKDTIMQVLNTIEKASKQSGAVTGISSGFYDLDYKTAGFQKSDLLLLAARPSMGKTALALNIAEHVVVKERIPTVFFSLEMSREQLANRLLSMNSKIDAQSIRTGNLKPNEWGELVESARILGESTLIIDDTPGISVREMRSKCRKLKMEKGLGFIIVDYLQLMTAGGKGSESRQQEISEISRSLKSLAREIECPVLALSQLSRDVEKRDNKRPQLSDLRESGAIEQDADVVMFIYRDEYYNKESEDKGVAEVIIGKQRNGPTGTVKLGSQLQYTRFTNLQHEKKYDNA